MPKARHLARSFSTSLRTVFCASRCHRSCKSPDKPSRKDIRWPNHSCNSPMTWPTRHGSSYAVDRTIRYCLPTAALPTFGWAQRAGRCRSVAAQEQVKDSSVPRPARNKPWWRRKTLRRMNRMHSESGQVTKLPQYILLPTTWLTSGNTTLPQYPCTSFGGRRRIRSNRSSAGRDLFRSSRVPTRDRIVERDRWHCLRGLRYLAAPKGRQALPEDTWRRGRTLLDSTAPNESQDRSRHAGHARAFCAQVERYPA